MINSIKKVNLWIIHHSGLLYGAYDSIKIDISYHMLLCNDTG